MERLAIITSHPIQYNAPIFKELTRRAVLEVKIFYTWGKDSLDNKFDPGFGTNIEWDIPLLDGYEYEFVTNISDDPGTHHFSGIRNPDLISRVELFKPDAILVFGWSYQSHLKVIRHFKNKVPVLFRGDSTMLDMKPGIRSLARRLFLTWVYSHIDYALYVGKCNREYFKTYGLKDAELFWAPHAIDNDRFSLEHEKLQSDALSMRREIGIPEHHAVLMFCGKLEPKKDPLILVRAFKEAEISDCHLLLVGSGDLEAALKDESKNLKNVHFLGFQNQKIMPAIYRMADVFVLPSKGPEETWGLAVNEAMASKRAVIVSDKCGCAVDLVDEGVNGFVFAANDKEQLKHQLKLFFSDRSKVKWMGEKSLEKVRQYSIEKVCDSIEQVVKKL
jgi:glycosyltransferase involved in cell wall biosynthesis